MPIRGDTDDESNIYQFDLNQSKRDLGLQVLLNEKHYISSHDILQEQEQLLILEVRRKIVERIKNKDFYAILADESSDITKKEQMSFTVRTSTDDYEAKDEFLGVYECINGLSSDSLLTYITDILLRCNLDYHKVAAIGFDGASVMKCLASKLQNIFGEQAHYFHCMAHCNELIVKDAHGISSLLSDSLNIVQSIYAIVGAYPKTYCIISRNSE